VLAWADGVVAACEPKETDPIFLPFVYGENVGYPAKATFLGLGSQHTRAEVLRAVYEGCVFSHNMHMQRLYAFREKPEVVRITGGAARSAVWMQMFADTFQVPVEVPDGSELGALGAAIAGAVASGLYPAYDVAIKAMTRVARRYEPNQASAAMVAKRYAIYSKACQALKAFYS
jgi:L-xylulokinase